jgi:hypothetical protein
VGVGRQRLRPARRYDEHRSQDGQLCIGSTTDQTSPTQVSGISTASAAVGGSKHTVILLSAGTLKACG